MRGLERVKSQHFVSSPRKAPFKRALNRHPSKKRRLGSNAAAEPVISSSSSSNGDETIANEDEAEEEDIDEDSFSLPGPSRSRDVLSSEAGQQAVNQPRSKGKKKVKGARNEARDTSVLVNRRLDVFGSTDDMSPKKRKRGQREPQTPRSETSGSWVEMDEDEDDEDGEDDEEEPEFIAESDQHLLQDAPPYALHRLRKAELIRLWKVAGMWTDDASEDGDIAQSEDDDGGLTKNELIDGLVAARRRAERHSSPLHSPRRSSHLESAFETKRLRSASSSAIVSTASSSSSNGDRRTSRPTDTDATPKAAPRTRSRPRRGEGNLLRSVHKRPNGVANGRVKGRGRDSLFRSRSKSLGGDERKARFGDDVKSPGKALITRRSRRASTQSSYTTTDNSPPSVPPPTRQTPRRRKSAASRNSLSSRSLGKTSSSRVGFAVPDDTDAVAVGSSDDESNEQPDPTPIVHRLRSRSRSSFLKEPSSELEADGEDESEVDGRSESSPVSVRRLRSQDKANDPDEDMPVSQPPRRGSRSLPARGAKKKAMQALKDGESDEEGMDLDEEDIGGVDDLEGEADEDEAMDQDDAPRSGPRTRSQLRAEADEDDQAEMSDDDADTSRERIEPSLTPLPESRDEMDQDFDREETPSEAIERQTRSGKTFGMWQNRRNRLRQEAMEDPDMDVEDDTDDDDNDESFEADIDLTDATLSSLIRLLRDELVQMCEARGIEVGGTKPQLAKALLEWNASDAQSTTSSQETARPKSPKASKASKSRKLIHAVGSNVHVEGKTTPVLLRDHYHATDPATPPHSDDSKRTNEAELNLDLSELGLEDSMIKPSQLQKLEKIGSGGFKDVYIGKLRGRKVAISEFREHLSEMDIRELKLLAEFSHPNIVRFRGICIPEDNSQIPCMLVSELCENGDLFDYIRNVPCPPLKRVLQLMLDIARGLEYLHTRNPAIIHRDCKSSNILINRAGQAKVGDFGLARVKHSTRSMIRSLVGTVNWQAPELWHPQPRYDYKVDVFSAAVVYWEMMSGWTGEKKYPWEGHNEHYIYDAVGQKHKRPSVTGLKKHWGAEPVNLMERMWHQDPGERPTMTDVVVDLEVLIAECDGK